MVHPTYIAIISACFSCAVAAHYWIRLRNPVRPIVLSDAVQKMVNEVVRYPLEVHLKRSVQVPLNQGLSLYSNSRLLLAEAHRLWLDGKQDPEDTALYEIANETYRELSKTFKWYMAERVLSFALPRRFPVYSLLMAETFSDLLEAVRQLAERRCDDHVLTMVASFA